jgi:hypothetical protein
LHVVVLSFIFFFVGFSASLIIRVVDHKSTIVTSLESFSSGC